MRLHESHNDGGFVVPNNTISRHATAYTTNARCVAFLGTFARPAQEVWLPGNYIQDPTTWIVPSLRTLKHLPETLLQDYDCTEQPVANQPAQPSGAGCSGVANAGAPHPPPPARVQDTGVAPSSCRSSTVSMRHTIRGRMLFLCLPVPRTSSLLHLAPSRRNSVSCSSSPHTGPTSSPCVRGTLACCSRSNACYTYPRSTKLLSRTPLFVWK